MPARRYYASYICHRMDVCDRRGYILFFILLQMALCTTGNKGCGSSIHVDQYAISGVNLKINSYNSKNCMVLKDPTTLSRMHGYPSDREIEILQGMRTRFICSVQTHSNCQNTTVTLKLGQAATCHPLPTTSSLFKVRNNSVCNTNTDCKTSLFLFVKSVEGMITIESVLQIHRTSYINFTINGFQSLKLTYQTCMDEVLEFQLPMSANVPLDVACKEYTGPVLLKKECLMPESTAEPVITSEGINAAESLSNHTNTTAITPPPSDSRAKDTKYSKLRHFALIISVLSISTISLLGIMALLAYRFRRQQRLHKYRYERLCVLYKSRTDRRKTDIESETAQAWTRHEATW